MGKNLCYSQSPLVISYAFVHITCLCRQELSVITYYYAPNLQGLMLLPFILVVLKHFTRITKNYKL